jgi:hypothetical protein
VPILPLAVNFAVKPAVGIMVFDLERDLDACFFDESFPCYEADSGMIRVIVCIGHCLVNSCLLGL